MLTSGTGGSGPWQELKGPRPGPCTARSGWTQGPAVRRTLSFSSPSRPADRRPGRSTRPRPSASVAGSRTSACTTRWRATRTTASGVAPARKNAGRWIRPPATPAPGPPLTPARPAAARACGGPPAGSGPDGKAAAWAIAPERQELSPRGRSALADPGVAEGPAAQRGRAVLRLAAGRDHGDLGRAEAAQRGTVGGGPGVADLAEVGQREDAAAAGAAGRLGDDLSRGPGQTGLRLGRGVGPVLRGVRDLQCVLVAGGVGHRRAHLVAGPDRVVDLDRARRVHLVPGVVLGGAAGAVDLGAGLLDRVAVVSVEADPEARVLVT